MTPALTPLPDDEFDRLTDAELLDRLRAVTELTVRCLCEAARIWARLEARGHDMAPLRSGLLLLFAKIAAGTLAAEAVARFYRTAAMGAVATLPPERQRELAAGGPVDVAVVGPDGRITHRAMPVHALSRDQIRLVFRGGFVRPVAEQIAELEAARLKPPPARPGRSRLYGRVRADAKKGVLIVGRTEVPLRDVLDALKESGSI